MKILELFCGTKSFSNVAEEYGHRTFTIDVVEGFEPDLCKDILQLEISDIPFKPDFIWASPPCKTFSVASISHHWKGGKCAYIPKTKECKIGLELLNKTLNIINLLNPTYYIIENPRGVMRKIGIMRDLNKNTVTYCQYGDDRMKPTDLWNNIYHWKSREMCKNGDSCHQSAPRGSRTGTQGRENSKERSRVPRELCEEILEVVQLK